ncbi:MAG: hypothetical protein IJO48_07220 [Clostridia bacterium]|nr:hypothetical protein [Clostridia bacterium]
MKERKDKKIGKLQTALIIAVIGCIVLIVSVLVMKGNGTYGSYPTNTTDAVDTAYKIAEFFEKAEQNGLDCGYEIEKSLEEQNEYNLITGDKFTQAKLVLVSSYYGISSFTIETEIWNDADNGGADMSAEIANLKSEYNAEILEKFKTWVCACASAFDDYGALAYGQIQFLNQYIDTACSEKESLSKTLGDYNIYIIFEHGDEFDKISVSLAVK